MPEYLLKTDKLCKSFRLGGLVLGTKIMAVDHVSLALPKDKPVDYKRSGRVGQREDDACADNTGSA